MSRSKQELMFSLLFLILSYQFSIDNDIVLVGFLRIVSGISLCRSIYFFIKDGIKEVEDEN